MQGRSRHERVALDAHRVELSGDAAQSAFSLFVMTEIVLKGYATHGADGLPAPVPRL